MTRDRARLDAAIQAALARRASAEAAALYAEAADRSEAAGAAEEAAFFRVAGFVYALEAGSPLAEALSLRLAEQGRETPYRAA